MTRRTLPTLAMLATAAAILFTTNTATAGCRLWDCLVGAQAAPAPVNTATTYAPLYTPAIAAPVAAPCSSCATVVPTYDACASSPCDTVCAPSCSPCVPQTCNYMPTTAYMPVGYTGTLVTAYRPTVAAYPLTTYRPFLGTYQTRYVPYTTYQPYNTYYRPAVVYAPAYGGCAPCASPCASGACGGGCPAPVVYPAAPACSGCAVPSVQPVEPPAAPSVPNGNVPNGNMQNGRTFETNKPEAAQPAPPTADPQVKPIPANNNASPSSLQRPLLIDPNDRTASNVSAAPRFQLTAQTAPVATPTATPKTAAPLKDDGGWVAVE